MESVLILFDLVCVAILLASNILFSELFGFCLWLSCMSYWYTLVFVCFNLDLIYLTFEIKFCKIILRCYLTLVFERSWIQSQTGLSLLHLGDFWQLTFLTISLFIKIVFSCSCCFSGSYFIYLGWIYPVHPDYVTNI